MTLLLTFGAWLTLMPGVVSVHGWAENPAPGPTTITQEQSNVTTQAQAGTVERPQGETSKAPAERQRSAKRSPRSSKRQPPASTRESVERARTSRDAGPTTQELTLSTNLFGGYDDNLTAGSGTGAGVVPAAIASGSTAFLDATLGYFRGNTLRSIRIDSTGNLRAYPDYLDRPAAGGTMVADARTTVGQKLTIAASERTGYEPLFTFFSPGTAGASLLAAAADTIPATGLLERRSFRSDTGISIERQWDRRHSTSISYAYRVQRFTGDDDRGDSSSHEVLAEYRRRVTRSTRVRAEYGFLNGEYTAFMAGTRPRREHRIEAGPEIEKALSRRRRLMVALSAGASRVESVGSVDREPYHAWVPSGSASANLSVSPLWSVEGGYRRSFSLLQGITDDVYTTDMAYVTTGGLVTRRIDLRLGATYSDGKTTVTGGGRFDVYGASLQTRVALTRTLAAFAGYFYYHHHYSNPAALPRGFPAEYDRNAVRVGITVVVPLVGRSTRTPLNPR